MQDPNEDKNVRESAAKSLGIIGSEVAIYPLIQVLQDPSEDKNVRESAAKSLGIIGSKVAINPLIKASEESNKYLRKAARMALRKIGSEDHIKHLIKALGDPNENVRRVAAESLGKVGSEAAIKFLIGALESSDENVRQTAIEFWARIGIDLERIGIDSARLLDRLDPFDYSGYRHAEEVAESLEGILGTISSEFAIKSLIQTWNNSNEEDVYVIAQQTLKRIGIGLEKLLDCRLQQKSYPSFYRRSHWNNRQAQSEEEFSPKIVIVSLIEALETSNENVRTIVEQILERISTILKRLYEGNNRNRGFDKEAFWGQKISGAAINYLSRRLENTNENVRRIAVVFLTSIGFEAFDRFISIRFRDLPENEVESLEKIDSEIAIKILIKALKDPNRDVRTEVATSLKSMASSFSISWVEDPEKIVRTTSADLLEKIVSEDDIITLIEFLEDSEREVRRVAIKFLNEISSKNGIFLKRIYAERAINPSIQILQDPHEDSNDVHEDVIEFLGKIGTGNEQAITTLAEISSNPSQSKSIREKAARALGKIGMGNEQAISILAQVLSSSQDAEIHKKAIDILGKIVQNKEQFAIVLRDLKVGLNDSETSQDCYESIWQCAQRISYPDFYEVWHLNTSAG